MKLCLRTVAACLVLAACGEDSFELFDPNAAVMEGRYALQTINNVPLPIAYPDTVNPSYIVVVSGDTLVFQPDGYLVRRMARWEVFAPPGGVTDTTFGTIIKSGSYEMLGNRVVLWIQYRAPIATADTATSNGANALEFVDPTLHGTLRYQRVP